MTNRFLTGQCSLKRLGGCHADYGVKLAPVVAQHVWTGRWLTLNVKPLIEDNGNGQTKALGLYLKYGIVSTNLPFLTCFEWKVARHSVIKLAVRKRSVRWQSSPIVVMQRMTIEMYVIFTVTTDWRCPQLGLVYVEFIGFPVIHPSDRLTCWMRKSRVRIQDNELADLSKTVQGIP